MEQECTVEPAGLPGTNFPDCTDNPAEYTVLVDIQINFVDDEFAACDGGEDQESCINTNIAATLNEVFPTTVPDWEGTADFAGFVFDPAQEVLNRRRLAEASSGTTARFLQEGECPTRNVDCGADYCRWGCIQVATTDCGTSALTNWVNLGEDLRAKLATLGYDCLGIADELGVVVLVDDANTGSVSRDNILFSRTRKDPNAILEGSSGDDAEDDATVRTLSVRGDLTFHFVDGTAKEPTDEEISSLEEKTTEFFSDNLKIDPKFSKHFLQFELEDVSYRYIRGEDDDRDVFEMTFLGQTQLDLASRQNHRDAAEAMASFDFDEYIASYVWNSEPFERSQFYETTSVKFVSMDARRKPPE